MTEPIDLLPDRVRQSLSRLEVDAEIVACDPELSDTAQFCAAYGYPLAEAANTILLASKRPPGKFAVCMVLADTRLDVNHKAKTEIGVSRLSFANPEVTREVTGMEIGGVTPFGLPEELEILTDAAVMNQPTITLGAGTRAAKIRCQPHFLTRIPQLRVVENLAHPIESKASS